MFYHVWPFQGLVVSTANENESCGGGEEAAVTRNHHKMAAFLCQTTGEVQLKKKNHKQH